MHIGIDIGTSSVKAVAIDNQGFIYTVEQVSYSIFSPQPDFQEQSSDEIFEATKCVLQNVIHKVGINHVESVCFSAVMHSLMAVDIEGNPLTNLIIWADNRAKQLADSLRNSETGEAIYARTGTAIHAMSPLCKLLWFKENYPELLQNVHKLIGIKEYIFFKLFGEYIIDFSIASATGLFDIFELKWCKKSLQLIGIEEDRLSKLVPTESIFYFNYQFGNEEKTLKFVIGASDGCLANLGAGAIDEGEIAATIGTSGAVRMTVSKPSVDEQMRTFCYITSENQYIVGGAINNGGIITQWLKETFPPPLPHYALASAYDVIFSLAATVPAGAESLIFLPYLLGERAPIWDADAKGVFFGIQKKHTQAHFYRAVLEGVIFALYSVGVVFEGKNHTQNSIYATGGFTKSDFWVQVMADIFDQKVLVPNSSESTAIGACLLGMKALGEIKDWKEAKKLIVIEKEFAPNKENSLVYKRNFEIFEKLYQVLKPMFSLSLV
jgi:gluconokinase